jgi:hypothetical protein
MSIKGLALRSCALAVVCAAMPGIADSAPMKYFAELEELNDSGVSGRMNFMVDMSARTLTVFGKVMGLEANQVHVQHVHGRFDDAGNPMDSVTPDASDDADGDGFVEVAEGAPAYGDILLPLVTEVGSFATPMVGGDGMLDYSQIFDLDDDSLFLNPISGTQYEGDDLLPLEKREYVIHGLTVPGGISDMLPNGGYLATLPVAAAEIAPIPLPAGAAFLLTGVAAFGAAGWRRRRLG